MQIEHKTLFLPGPTEVRPEIRQACSKPMVGHRSSEYSAVHREVVDGLQELLHTDGRVFLSTSSATGVMEAAIRNLVSDKLLSCVCGAFSHRWNRIARANGKEADRLEVEWGEPTLPEQIDRRLEQDNYEAVTVVHNESSTGLTNPIEEIGEMMENHPDVLFLVDAVSSMAGTEIRVDDWNIDLVLASVQKAFALPPGLAVFAVSDQALERFEDVPDRGYYFDFANFIKYGDRDQTISTGPIPQIFALERQLDYILNTEGPEQRYRRHMEMASHCRQWALERGFSIFPDSEYASPTVTCVQNDPGISVSELRSELEEQGFVISDGYGDLAEQTFRIGHMGDHSLEDLQELLSVIDQLIN